MQEDDAILVILLASLALVLVNTKMDFSMHGVGVLFVEGLE